MRKITRPLKGNINIELHSYQAIKTLNGRHVEGKPIIPGINDFQAYTTLAIQSAKSGDPFAHQALAQLEEIMSDSEKKLMQLKNETALLLEEESGRVSADPGLAENPDHITLTVGKYAAQAVTMVGILDEVIVNLLTAAHMNKIIIKEKYRRIEEARSIIRSMFNAISRYRHTGVTRDDLVANNELARSAIKKLVDSGFIDLSLYKEQNDFEDMRQYYANFSVGLNYTHLKLSNS